MDWTCVGRIRPPLPDAWNGMFFGWEVLEGRVFADASEHGVYEIDVSRPTRMKLVRKHPERLHPVRYRDFAYEVSGDDPDLELGVLRLGKRPGTLRAVRGGGLTGELRRLQVHGDQLFALTLEELAVFDLVEPDAPRAVARFPIEGGRSLSFIGSLLYVTTLDRLEVYDLSVKKPRRIAHLSSPLRDQSEYEVSHTGFFGDLFVVRSRWLIDVSRPKRPASIDVIRVRRYLQPVERLDDRLVVLDEHCTPVVVALEPRRRPLRVTEGKIVDRKGRILEAEPVALAHHPQCLLLLCQKEVLALVPRG